MSEFAFQPLRKNILDYAQRKRLITPIEEIDFRVKSEFLMLLAIHKLVPEKEPISPDIAIVQFWELFLD